MKISTNRKIALATLGVMAASTAGGMGMGIAEASSKGRKNTMLGLGAVTAYGLLKKKRTVAIGGALGTAYAYKRYKDSRKDEKTAEARRRAWYQQRYGSAWRNHYVPG